MFIINDDPIEDIYNFIKFNENYINKKILLNILITYRMTITLKMLIHNKIINIDADTMIGLFKLNIENLNNITQKEIFIICANKILPNILENDKICNKIIKNNYLKLLPFNFIINNNNDTICHLLCLHKYYQFHKDIIIHILAINMNIVNYTNNYIENCIFNCVKSNNKELFNMLLDIKCNVELKNIKGNYLIHTIIQNNNFSFLQLLYAKSTNKNIINLQNDNGETPIILSAKNKNISMVNFLYKCNCDLTKQDNYGNYVYHYLVLYGLSTDIPPENKKNNNDYTVTEYALTYILKLFENN